MLTYINKRPRSLKFKPSYPNLLKKLKPHQQIDLGNKIIKTEVKVAINTTNNGKIRCPVKLSIEFCNGFWRIVGPNVRKFFLIDLKWKGA